MILSTTAGFAGAGGAHGKPATLRARLRRFTLVSLFVLLHLQGGAGQARGAELLRAPYLAFALDHLEPLPNSIGKGPVDVAAGDLDGDGRDDLAVVSRDWFGVEGGRLLSILLSDPNPTLPALGAAAQYQTGFGPSAVALGDLDGDGLLDVVIADASDRVVSFFANRGGGVLRERIVIGTGGIRPMDVAVQDLNGDARNDLVVATSTGALAFLASGPPGSFSAPIASTVTGGVQSVAVGPIDDGPIPDLLVVTSSPNTLAILRGVGDGTFAPAGAPPLLYPSKKVALADMTGDGRLDAVVVATLSSRVTVYANAAMNPFTTTTVDRLTSGVPTGLVCRDLDQDMVPDVAAVMQVGASGSFRTCALLYGDGVGGFAQEIAFDLGPYLESIDAGDLNGDGRPDLAACGAGVVADLRLQRAVHVALQTTFGTFGIGSSYRTIANDVTFASLLTADMNRDAKADVIVPGVNDATGQASVTIRPGLGDGTWDPGFQFIVPGDLVPRAVPGDFDRDGDIDLVVTRLSSAGTPGSSSAMTYLGNGDGTIVPLGASLIGDAGVLAAGDLDRDGTLDIVMDGVLSHLLLFFLGLGDGTFTPASAFSFASGKPLAATVGDMNRDGFPDVVVSVGQATIGEPTTGFGAYVLLGDGTGVPGTPTKFTSVPYRTLQLADLDDDGILDLVADGRKIHRGLGNGTFAPAFTAGMGTPHSLWSAIVDLNRDGRLDVVSDNEETTTFDTYIDPRLDVWLGGGMPAFGAHGGYGVGRRPLGLAALDANRDGRDDVVAFDRDPGFGNPQNPWLVTLLGNGPATFAFPASVVPSAVPSSQEAMVLDDFTQDGRPDAVVTRNDGGLYYATLLAGNGNGTFATSISNPLPNEPTALASGDLNRDGIPDVAIACGAGDAVLVQLGTPYDTLSVPVTVVSPQGYEFSDIAIADFNRDGKPDLAAASAASATILVLLGNGDGTFAAPAVLSTGSEGPTSIAVGDLDRNGRLDLVAALGNGVSPSSIGVLHGNGDGTFQTIRPYAAGSSPQAIALADFDRDGVLDVAVTRIGPPGARAVAVLLGFAGGGFNSPVSYPITGNAYDIAVGDLDGDGILDLIAPGGLGSSVIAFLHGQTGGTFAANVDHFIGATPWALGIADLNEDGRPDIAGTLLAATNVAVLLSAPSTITGVEPEPSTEAPPAPRLTIRPNPASSHASLAFTTPASSRATVDLFDVHGRRVARLFEGPVDREVEVTWTGRGERGGTAAAGVYFAKLTTAQGTVVTRKLVWMR